MSSPIVLIDTLWNVKLYTPATHPDGHLSINRYTMECKGGFNRAFSNNSYVLIDTLWNVKTVSPSDIKLEQSCINRYTMECKDAFDFLAICYVFKY